jgi:hypothetical protein
VDRGRKMLESIDAAANGSDRQEAPWSATYFMRHFPRAKKSAPVRRPIVDHNRINFS